MIERSYLSLGLFAILPYLMLLTLLGVLPSCTPEYLQTVETGEVFLPEQDPKYQFVRNRESSVDLQEAELTLLSGQDLLERYINEARISRAEHLEEALSLFRFGLYGYALLPRTAQSPLFREQRSLVVADIEALIHATAELSGLGAERPNEHRRREARPGQSGYIATSASSKLSFVDARGLVLAEVLKTYLLGAVALDQVLGVHADDAVVTNLQLTSDHSAQKLLKGKNYTELEQRWDTAYAYYLYGLRHLALGNGVVALRGVLRKLDLAFTLGRIDMDYFLYDKLPEHIRTLRQELARALVIRIETLLLGGNTLANLKEDARFALSMLSEAYGLIYALQFLRNDQGEAYFSRAEVQTLQSRLVSGTGLWDVERLLGRSDAEGDLSIVLRTIKERIAL